MSNKIGEFNLKLYPKNRAYQISLPDDEFMQIVMFAYYFDRVVHTLSQQNRAMLIEAIYNTAYDFHETLFNDKNSDLKTLIKKALFDQFKNKKTVSEKVDFEVHGEYFRKGESFFYLNTKYKPLIAKNVEVESGAITTIMSYFDYLLENVSKLRIMFLIAMLKIMAETYIESLNNKSLPGLNEVPAKGLNAASEFIELVTKKA